jgi:hypothetical protein
MTLLAALLLVSATTALVVLVSVGVLLALDGWDARRDAARRNQARRVR